MQNTGAGAGRTLWRRKVQWEAEERISQLTTPTTDKSADVYLPLSLLLVRTILMHRLLYVGTPGADATFSCVSLQAARRLHVRCVSCRLCECVGWKGKGE